VPNVIPNPPTPSPWAKAALDNKPTAKAVKIIFALKVATIPFAFLGFIFSPATDLVRSQSIGYQRP
jgi:hypothetical protein